jgi:hypothetical protein
MHQTTPPGVDVERTEHPPLARRRRHAHHEPTGEALWRAEAVWRDLMADRARDAVGGEPVLFGLSCANRQMLEELAELAARSSTNGRHRHVADRALVFDLARRRWMIYRLASDRGLPIRIARRVRHHRRAPRQPDRHILARRRREPVVAGKAFV